jgi:NAD(P)-dependent dehydrogenase (short-subunit alcohol dehydrogenase family)
VETFIVTGSNTGVGLQLVHILFQQNGNIYMATRNEEKSLKAIEEMKRLYPDSNGQIHYLHLDLADLRSVKKAAEEFASKEHRLDVLWHNAGLYSRPEGGTTKQVGKKPWLHL